MRKWARRKKNDVTTNYVRPEKSLAKKTIYTASHTRQKSIRDHEQSEFLGVEFFDLGVQSFSLEIRIEYELYFVAQITVSHFSDK